MGNKKQEENLKDELKLRKTLSIGDDILEDTTVVMEIQNMETKT